MVGQEAARRALLEQMRADLAALSRSGEARDVVALGVAEIDAALSGGLQRAGLHEIEAAGALHMAAAEGFGVAVAARAAGARPLVWIRQDFLDSEAGEINGRGLAELGLDPAQVVLVKVSSGEDALRAGEQAVRTAALGAVVIEPWGEPKALDFTASRRLSLAAARSGVATFLLRMGVGASSGAAHSAALTRWRLSAAPSRALEANAPGGATFSAHLVRQRGGAHGQTWCVEWNRDRRCFEEPRARGRAALSRPVVPVPVDGSAAGRGASVALWRRAG